MLFRGLSGIYTLRALHTLGAPQWQLRARSLYADPTEGGSVRPGKVQRALSRAG